MIGYVYKTTNLLNDRVYIGKSAKSIFNPEYFGSGKLLRQAINKYGIENFKVEVLVWCETLEELDMEEIKQIEIHLDRAYNIAKGGTGGNTLSNASKEVREQCFEKRSEGMKRWHENMSDEEKEVHANKISIAKKGKVPNMHGYKHSEETKRKMSESNKAHIWTEEQRISHALAMEKRRGCLPHNARKIMIDGVIYNSMSEAKRILGRSDYLIFKDAKNGKIKLEYVDDEKQS